VSAVNWLEWGDPAFARARAEDRPILLTIVASWCRYCRDVDATTFADPAVIQAVEEGYVPVRVDKDRRPDVNERYNAGGWPTIAFLTPEGELLAGDTFLASEEILPLLRRIAPFYRENRDTIRARIADLVSRTLRAQERRETSGGTLSPEIPRVVAGAILEHADPVYGGFGEGQKFLHPEAVDFALVWYGRTRDDRMREVLERTLDSMAAGGIHDRLEGGFFRYATTRDWRQPNTEKLLESNAGPLRSFVEGWQVFEKEEYRRTAEGILRWLLATMRDPETGGFFGSQDADPEYYSLPLEERRRRVAPETDRTIYANWSAATVSALLKTSVVLGSEEARAGALRALEFLLAEMYDPSRGMHHYWDGTYHLAGLLTDQAYAMRMLVDAVQYTGENRYLAVAERLARVLFEQQASPGGGFYDIRTEPGAIGGLKRRNRSILENAVAAEALLRLSHFTRDETYREAARRTLEAFTRDYKQYGYYVAGYARAVDLFFHEPLHLTVIGSRSDPATEALRRAAFACYVPSRIVQVLDPEADADAFERAGLPRSERATAYLTVGRTSYASVTEPGELASVMLMAERDRTAREE